MSTNAKTDTPFTHEKILFFDGICVMCNSLVRFVLRHDKNHDVKFATLQGQTAEKLLPTSLRSNIKTVVFMNEHGLHTEADAIIGLFKAMGGILRLASILLIVPRFIRNYIYSVVAKNRYRWFGTTEQCALLTPQQKMRILD